MASFILDARGVSKHYSMACERLDVLRDVQVSLRPGELATVMGPSGSGKSTLVSLFAGLDPQFDGSIRVCGEDLQGMGERERVLLRSSSLGLVFQEHRLLPQLTALENVKAPLYLRRMASAERTSQAMDALELVGIGARAGHTPAQMSGGERQRASIARALVTGAPLLLCDEPTGSLNREMGMQIFQLLADLCQRFGKTAVVTTHDHMAVMHADRLFNLEHGQLREVPIEDGRRAANAVVKGWTLQDVADVAASG